MKKLLFQLFLATITFCALMLAASCKKKEKIAEKTVGIIESADPEDEAAEEPLYLPPVKENTFHSLFKGHMPDTVSFEGTVRAVSSIPDPEKNDYPNCLYAVFVELDSVLASTQQSKQIPYEVIVNVPVMKEQTILKSNIFLPGDRISCICAEYDAMPQEIQEIQLSDDIQSFEHQQYYALSIVKVKQFQKNGNRDFAKRGITILPIQSLPKDENAAKLRRERMQKEIARIEEELKQHGGSFAAWREEYKTIADKYKNLCRKKFKGWINDSYYSAIGDETTYNTEDYIGWILQYKQYLEKYNIDLIVVRFPSRADFAARVLASDDFHENPAWVEHYYMCLKNDIEIVDPVPEMWEKRYDYPMFYFYADPDNIHPFEGELIIAAEKLSHVLSRYSYPKNKNYELRKRIVENNELYTYPDGNPSFTPHEPMEFDGLSEKNGTVGLLQVNTGSPFVFLSNSLFGTKAMRNRGASIPHYTSYFLQTTVDWKHQSGVRNPMIRNLISVSSNLDNRKAVIMVGSHDSWSGGPNIPKYFSESINRIVFEKSFNFLSKDIAVFDVDSYELAKDRKGSLHVSQDASRKGFGSFSVELPVAPPADTNYKTCMIRINIKTDAGIINLTVYDRNIKTDATTLTHSSDAYADLFVPITQQTDKVRIVFADYVGKPYIVENIELWYY